MKPPVQLDVFELRSLLGEGGMGEVFLGSHMGTGAEVAIKIMRQEQAASPETRAGFLREVRSAARMSHTNIIHIVDCGEVRESEAAASQGLLNPHVPYIVMELATRGSLADITGQLSWMQLRWMLLEILNALAHAHARRVVHRDLKPDNVLLTDGEHGRTALKLADFGIAHSFEPTRKQKTRDFNSLYAGTPAYMAPEQLLGDWRDFGPWTDLYALGCMAFECCCGVVPFEGQNMFEIMHKQLSSEPSTFVPKMLVPMGLEEWILRLLEKDPMHRFATAADAAWALTLLEELDPDDLEDEPPTQVLLHGAEESIHQLEADPSHSKADTLQTSVMKIAATQILIPIGYSEDGMPLFEKNDVQPLPSTWERMEYPQKDLQFVDAGLGLFGLREVPYVGQIQARDLIWGALRTVHQEQRPRAVVLSGDVGVGKSRLMSWLGERAHEVGGARLLYLEHHANAAPSAGLVELIERELASVNLSTSDALERIQKVLPRCPRVGPDALEPCEPVSREDALKLLAIIRPDSLDEVGATAGPASVTSRFDALVTLLVRAARERPVFLWIDDAHRNPEAFAWVRVLMTHERTRNLPVMTLMSYSKESTLGPRSQGLLDALLATPGVESVALETLARGEERALIKSLLAVDAPLSERLVERSQGSPRKILEILGSWIEQDILTPGEHGYRLKPDASVSQEFLPETGWLQLLIDSWMRRDPEAEVNVEHVHMLLELGATLGLRPLVEEWQGVGALHGLKLAPELLNAAVSLGIGRIEGARFVFLQESVHDRLLEVSQTAGRWIRHNRMIALGLERLYPEPNVTQMIRLANHLLEGRSFEAAVEPLTRLVDMSLRQGDNDLNEETLASLGGVLHKLHVPPGDDRNGQLLLRKLERLICVEGPRAAADALQDAMLVALQNDWGFSRCALDGLQASNLLDRGNAEGALPLLASVSERCADTGNSEGLAECFLGFGNVHLQLHRLDEAGEYLNACQDLLAELPQTARVMEMKGDVASGWAERAIRQESWEEAEAHITQALSAFERAGAHQRWWETHLLSARIARARGELDLAAQLCLDVHAQLTDMGRAGSVLASLQCAIVLLHKGWFAAAKEALMECVPALERRGYAMPTVLGHLAMSWACIGQEQVEDARDAFHRARTLLIHRPMLHPQIARLSQHIASKHSKLAQPADALDALELSQAQWFGLGDEHRSREIRKVAALMKRLATTS